MQLRIYIADKQFITGLPAWPFDSTVFLIIFWESCEIFSSWNECDKCVNISTTMLSDCQRVVSKDWPGIIKATWQSTEYNSNETILVASNYATACWSLNFFHLKQNLSTTEATYKTKLWHVLNWWVEQYKKKYIKQWIKKKCTRSLCMIQNAIVEPWKSLTNNHIQHCTYT